MKLTEKKIMILVVLLAVALWFHHKVNPEAASVMMVA